MSLIALGSMSVVAHADTVQLYAAGSLKVALTDVAKAYEGASGNKVEAKYGAFSSLKNEHCRRRSVQVFASASDQAGVAAVFSATRGRPGASSSSRPSRRWKM